MAIFDQNAEQMDREELAQMQLERLQGHPHPGLQERHVLQKEVRRDRFPPEDCQSLEDLARLPFTTRHDLARAYPYEMFAVPLREVVRIHSSTGSPGNPIVMGYTSRDLRHWAGLAARILTAAGVDRDDVVQVTLSYSLLTSAFGIHYGVELLGASVIPSGPGFTARQVQVMRDYRTTAVLVLPRPTPLRWLMKWRPWEWTPRTSTSSWRCWPGSPGPRPCGPKSRAASFCTALDHYALSEVMGPGVAGECAVHPLFRHAHQRRPLPAPGHRPGHGGASSARRTGRDGHYHPHPGGHAPGLLQDRGPGAPVLRALPLRPDAGPDEPHRRPGRRSGYCQGDQYLSHAGGPGPGRRPGGGAGLSAGSGPGGAPGLPGGQGRGPGRNLFCDKMTKQRELLQEIGHKLAQGIGQVQPRGKTGGTGVAYVAEETGRGHRSTVGRWWACA